MSSTNKTTYYELPQFVDNDIFNPLVDDNDAYGKIDTALHNIADAEAENASDIVGIKSRLDGAEGDIDALEAQNGDSVLTTTAQTLSGAVNELDADVSALDGRLDIVEDDINNVSTGLKVKVSALEAQNGNEALTTTAQTLSGAVNELNKLSIFVTPEMFGAVGDGNTDDTTAFSNMLTAVNSNNIGKVICGKNKKYKITNALTLPVDVEIDFNNCIFVVNELATLFENLSVAKYTDNVSTITAGSVDITVTDASTLKEGDLIVLKGDNLIDGARTAYISGITTVITKIAGNVITIANSAIYDIENAIIAVYDKHSLVLKNLGGIEGSLTYGFVLSNLQNVMVEHFNVEDCKVTTLIGFGECFNATVTNSNIKCHNDAGALCYPVFFGGTTNGNVTLSYIESTWHCISTGGSSPVLYTHIDKCVLVGSGTAHAFGDHGNAFYSSITNSELTGCDLANFARIESCDIKISTGISGQPCELGLTGNDIIDIDFYIKDVRFHKVDTTSVWGVVIGFAPQTAITSSHIRNIFVDGIYDGAFFKKVQNGAVDVENLYCNNAHNTVLGGVSGWEYKLKHVTVENSELIALVLNTRMTNGGSLTVKNCVINTLYNIDLPTNTEVNTLEHVKIKSDTVQVRVGSGASAKNVYIDVVLESNDFGTATLYSGNALTYLICCDIPYINFGTGDKLVGSYNTRLSNTFINSFLNGSSGSYYTKKLSIDASNNVTASDM